MRRETRIIVAVLAAFSLLFAAKVSASAADYDEAVFETEPGAIVVTNPSSNSVGIYVMVEGSEDVLLAPNESERFEVSDPTVTVSVSYGAGEVLTYTFPIEPIEATPEDPTEEPADEPTPTETADATPGPTTAPSPTPPTETPGTESDEEAPSEPAAEPQFAAPATGADIAHNVVSVPLILAGAWGLALTGLLRRKYLHLS